MRNARKISAMLDLDSSALEFPSLPPSPERKTMKFRQDPSEEGRRCGPEETDGKGLTSSCKLSGRLLANACVGTCDDHYLSGNLYTCCTNSTSKELPVSKGRKIIHQSPKLMLRCIKRDHITTGGRALNWSHKMLSS